MKIIINSETKPRFIAEYCNWVLLKKKKSILKERTYYLCTQKKCGVL